MSSIYLNPKKLSVTNQNVWKAHQHLSLSITTLKQLQQQSLWMNNALYFQVSQTLLRIQSIQKQLIYIDCFVKESGAIYDRLEQRLNKSAKLLSNTSIDASSNQPGTMLLAFGKQTFSLIQKKAINTNGKTETISSQYQQWHVRGMDSYAQFDHNFGFQSLLKTIKNGNLRASFDVGGAMMAITYAERFCGIKHQLDIGLMNITMNGTASASLFRDHLFDPKLKLEVGASASLAKGIITDRWTNSFIDMETKVIGEVGVAYAESTALITKDQVKIKGDVGIAAFKGKASGAIEIMGVTISGSVSGDVGGVGIGGVLSASKDSFEIGGNVSCLLGGGFDFKVEW